MTYLINTTTLVTYITYSVLPDHDLNIQDNSQYKYDVINFPSTISMLSQESLFCVNQNVYELDSSRTHSGTDEACKDWREIV